MTETEEIQKLKRKIARLERKIAESSRVYNWVCNGNTWFIQNMMLWSEINLALYGDGRYHCDYYDRSFGTLGAAIRFIEARLVQAKLVRRIDSFERPRSSVQRNGDA